MPWHNRFPALSYTEQVALTTLKDRLKLQWGYIGGEHFEAPVARRLIFLRWLYEKGRLVP